MGKKKGSAGGNGSAKKVAAETKVVQQQSNELQALEMKAVTLKVNCLCDGCLSRIKKGATKSTIGEPPELSVDKSKNQVTVKGYLGVDAEYLAYLVKKKLKRGSVNVVPPPKKEADKTNKKGGNDKEAPGGGGHGGAWQPQQLPGYVHGYGYGYGYPYPNFRPEPVYHPGYPYGYHPQAQHIFSYPNPIANAVMWPGAGGYN